MEGTALAVPFSRSVGLSRFPCCSQSQPLHKQILQPPQIRTVPPGGLEFTIRAFGLPCGVSLDDPSITAECRTHNPDARSGLPSWSDLHPDRCRDTRSPGQPGHFTSTEIATDPVILRIDQAGAWSASPLRHFMTVHALLSPVHPLSGRGSDSLLQKSCRPCENAS
jgi:hypothetical protein